MQKKPLWSAIRKAQDIKAGDIILYKDKLYTVLAIMSITHDDWPSNSSVFVSCVECQILLWMIEIMELYKLKT